MAYVPYSAYDSLGPLVKQRRRVLALSLVGLALFLSWEAVRLSSYIKAESRPPAWDQAIHMEIALDFHRAAGAGRLSEAFHLAPKPGMPPFPPLYYLGLMRAYGSPNPAGAALWVNWFYLAVLCVSLFGAAWEFRSDSTALAATIAFCCAPGVQELLTTQLVDLSVVALAAASYWALLRSEGFARWPGSLAFGACFAAGMLHKWSFFSYMLPAYYWGLKALGSPSARLRVLASAALALAGFAPWYATHASVLLPRLLQASSDFAVPVWRGGVFFQYFLNSADSLGPLFWALAWVALLIPQYRRNWERGWVIPAWVASSYVFWAIVPNRQMRFLMPGLPGLAVALCGAWPEALLWPLAALQLFGAANFTAGWIAPFRVPFPFHSLQFLPTQPPAAEDWKIADILREAQKRRDPASPVANLTLVANAPRFNGPNFTWTAKLLELPNVRIRGVNSRLCEFSEFVLLKNGELGPPSVIGGLPEASGVIQAKGGWFSKAYEEAARWPLPDKTAAILYQRRRLAEPPFKGKGISFQFYTSGPLEAKNLKVEFGPWDQASGTYSWARATADEVVLRGLKVTGLEAEFEGLALVPAGEGKGAAAWDEVRFLKLGRLKVKALRVAAADLAAFLESRAKGLQVQRLELDGGARLKAAWRHLTVSAEAGVLLKESPSRLEVAVSSARVGASPVPGALLGPFRSFTVPLEPNPETPFWIELAGLTFRAGRLSVP